MYVLHITYHLYWIALFVSKDKLVFFRILGSLSLLCRPAKTECVGVGGRPSGFCHRMVKVLSVAWTT